MKLSKKDRVFLINQYKILSAIESDNISNYDELIAILENGYEIFYPLIDDWVLEDMPTLSGKFVLDILDLYRAIEDVKRSTKDKDLIANTYSYFHGFDGNLETEYMGFARFLIEKQSKYLEQQQYLIKNDNMNSHRPMLDKYTRMIERSKSVDDIWSMSLDDALAIINA